LYLRFFIFEFSVYFVFSCKLLLLKNKEKKSTSKEDASSLGQLVKIG